MKNLSEFSRSCAAPMVRSTKESDGGCLFTWPPAASAGLERVNSSSEVLRFPASCLYPQLFVLSPLSCPLSPVPEPHSGLTLLRLPHTDTRTLLLLWLKHATTPPWWSKHLYCISSLKMLASFLFCFVTAILFLCYYLKFVLPVDMRHSNICKPYADVEWVLNIYFFAIYILSRLLLYSTKSLQREWRRGDSCVSVWLSAIALWWLTGLIVVQ